MTTFKSLLALTALAALAAGPALAHDEGTWILRAGVGTVDPKSDNLKFEFEGDSLTLKVDSGTSAVFSGTYMFTPKWGLDILAAVPFEHDIKATVTSGGESGTVKIGLTKHLPPTVSLQYHFIPDGKFQPYFGVGVNWTMFSDEKLVSELADPEVGLDKLKLDDSTGVALQIGGDFVMESNWVFNIDVRWINIETDTWLGGDALGGELVKIGTTKIDPLVYSLSFGYRF